MRNITAVCTIVLMVLLSNCSCSSKSSGTVELKRFPIHNMDGVIDQSGIRFDTEISSDGNGSLHIAADGPTTVTLFEISDIDVDDAQLIYQAKLRSKDVRGQVYLEMLCHFSGMGEFFSRDIRSPLTGTREWSTRETPFFLQSGQKPDYVKLNLVIQGSGSAWIDDIRLLKGPLG